TTSGPAQAPRPTSSTPATGPRPLRYSDDSSVRSPEDLRITVRGGHVADTLDFCSSPAGARVLLAWKLRLRIHRPDQTPPRRRPRDEPRLPDHIVHRNRAGHRITGAQQPTLGIGREGGAVRPRVRRMSTVVAHHPEPARRHRHRPELVAQAG